MDEFGLFRLSYAYIELNLLNLFKLEATSCLMNCLPTPPPDPLLINIKIEQYGSFCMILNNTTNYGPYNSIVSHIKHSPDYRVLSQELRAYMIKDSYV